ncbi:hypothetical protein B5V01_27340 [Mesorhizobium erdmanii]|uniref:Transposase IS4-like domain-containing protein n=2 Tax=Mesorhizobium TaxID=68287 RepID=A0A3M9X0I6_9HYPH|nr:MULTISPECIES: transposase [Mesorhizobium]RNJ41206.1 hypothetical protein DNR46_35380 [Mesorhizobium japonicum]RXT38037.1 hypothetical protein B5V01_27340 [Mesorhizobium erdmanii]
MATGSDHRGVVGYNVPAAVDTQHHIVVAHTVTNRCHDRSQLLEMAKAAQSEFGSSEMIALADRGYYEGKQIRACAEAGTMVPKPNTFRAAQYSIDN